MEHAYNSGRMRTHSHQIQLDGGEKSTKKLYRYSSELQISTKPLKISSNVTSSAHVASLVAFGAKLRENAMLSQVWRLTERSVLLNPAVDQSGWGGGANRFHTNAYEPNRYHQPRENPSHHFHSKHCWRILSVSLFSSNLFHRKNTSCDKYSNLRYKQPRN